MKYEVNVQVEEEYKALTIVSIEQILNGNWL